MFERVKRKLHLILLKLIPKKERNPGRLKIQSSIEKDEEDNRDYLFEVKGTEFEECDVPDKFRIIDNPEDFVKSQGKWGSCFPGKTKVLMEDLSEKKIKDVVIGDYVYTHTGKKQKVTNKFKRKWQGRTFKIKTFGSFEEIEATPEHPFLTQRGWVESELLKKTDYLVFKQINNIKNYNIYELEKDNDFLWVLGLYLAEGSIETKKGRVTFSLNSNEIDLANKIKKIMKKYGCEVYFHKKKGCNCLTVRFTNKYIARIFLELGNKICNKKKLAKRLLYVDPKKQLEIYRGWEAGDGNHKIIKGRHVVTTTSLVLAKQMQHILFRN